jgi:hypothetical protein
MKKAIVFAAAFAAGSALAQVGTWSGGGVGAGGGGAMSNLGVDGRLGAGPQIPATDMPATGQAAAAARPPRSAASAGTAGADSVGVGGASGAPQPSGSTPIVSGTTWGAAPSSAPLEDKADRQVDKP